MRQAALRCSGITSAPAFKDKKKKDSIHYRQQSGSDRRRQRVGLEPAVAGLDGPDAACFAAEAQQGGCDRAVVMYCGALAVGVD